MKQTWISPEVCVQFSPHLNSLLLQRLISRQLIIRMFFSAIDIPLVVGYQALSRDTWIIRGTLYNLSEMLGVDESQL